MNIYLIKRTDTIGYDEYDSAVVIAEDDEKARHIHPGGYGKFENGEWSMGGYAWAMPQSLEVTLIAKAVPDLPNQGVILASFNAG